MGRMPQLRKWIIVAIGIVALGLGVGFCSDDVLEHLARDGVVIDTLVVYKERELQGERRRGDSTLARFPTTIPTDTCKAVVAGERKAADAVVTAQKQRIGNLQRQNRLLLPSRLKAFADVDYRLQGPALLKGRLGATVGLMLRVDKATYAYAARVQPITGDGQQGWQVGVRREFRLF